MTSETPVNITVDGQGVEVESGTTIHGACTTAGIETPTLCWAENLTPVNVCRVCVVEVEGSRALVPSCSRVAEDGMVVETDSERVRHSRKMVLEFLGSGVDLSQATELDRWMDEYGADPDRYPQYQQSLWGSEGGSIFNEIPPAHMRKIRAMGINDDAGLYPSAVAKAARTGSEVA